MRSPPSPQPLPWPRRRRRRAPRSDWRPARSGSEEVAAAGGQRGEGRGRGLLRFLRAPRPGYSDGRQETTLSPGGERGERSGPGEASPGGTTRAAGGKLNCWPFSSPGPSLWDGRPRAGAASSPVGSGGTSRRPASAPAQGPPSLFPHARRRAPPSHRVPARRDRLHIRVLTHPRPQQHLL